MPPLTIRLALSIAIGLVCHGAVEARGDERLPQEPGPAPVLNEMQLPQVPALEPAKSRPVYPRGNEQSGPPAAIGAGAAPTVSVTISGPDGPVRYAATDRAGIQIIDPQTSRVLGTFGRDLPVIGLELRGQYLYVRFAGGTADVYQVQDPLRPVKLSADAAPSSGVGGSARRPGRGLFIAGVIILPLSAVFLVPGAAFFIKGAMEGPYSSAGCVFICIPPRAGDNFVGGFFFAFGLAAAITGASLIIAGARYNARPARTRPSQRVLRLAPYAGPDGVGLFALGRF